MPKWKGLMTNKQHPNTPPPELFKQWEDDILNERDNVDHVLDCAWRNGFQAGADQELEACCEWLGEAPVVYNDNGDLHPGSYLRDARRSKSLNKKQRGLTALEATNLKKDDPLLYQEILNAIEGLPND